MKVRIKRIDKTLPLPVYETKGAVGFDLFSREDVTLQPKEIKLIPTNVVVEVPDGYMLMLAVRSSTPMKRGLMKANSVGILDQDYCGNNDEAKLQLYNFTEKPIEVKRGEKVGQGVLVRVDKFEWEEVDDMERETRGGFGSTDEDGTAD